MHKLLAVTAAVVFSYRSTLSIGLDAGAKVTFSFPSGRPMSTMVLVT